MKKLGILFIGLAAFAACGQAEPKTEEVIEVEVTETEAPAEEAMAEEMAAEGDSIHFGKLIDAEGAISMEEFMNSTEGVDSMEVKIAAIAEDVCQKKGCWMKVSMAEEASMRIRFKDYGFFVPMDITGKEVVFSGMAYKETTSVEDLKHYAEDGGETQEAIDAITEPETSWSFMADGVLLR